MALDNQSVNACHFSSMASLTRLAYCLHIPIIIPSALNGYVCNTLKIVEALVVEVVSAYTLEGVGRDDRGVWVAWLLGKGRCGCTVGSWLLLHAWISLVIPGQKMDVSALDIVTIYYYDII